MEEQKGPGSGGDAKAPKHSTGLRPEEGCEEGLRSRPAAPGAGRGACVRASRGQSTQFPHS